MQDGTPNNLNAGTEKSCSGKRASSASIIQYTPPVFKENKAGRYIEFYAFDPAADRLRRKIIKLNHINEKCNFKQYVNGILIRLNNQLMCGWNPWITSDIGNLEPIETGLRQYDDYIEKMFADGLYRKETYCGYKSFLKMLRLYMETEKIYYIYQFDRKYCTSFLDWVFIDRNNGAQTRNNYLSFLKVLSGYFVEKGYLQSRPTDGIRPISKRLYTKSREDIPSDIVRKISGYCREHDPYFLLACYLLYYGLIRPVEMTRLRIKDFNLHEGTLTIPASCSKNRKEQSVMLPRKVLLYAIDLGIFSAPMGDYIFSIGLRPGTEQIDPKIFRDHWMKLGRPLGLRKEWKFYSLKDTGITEMLDNNCTTISVRDQARHSSLAITDIYTRHKGNVNPEFLDYDGSL